MSLTKPSHLAGLHAKAPLAIYVSCGMLSMRMSLIMILQHFFNSNASLFVGHFTFGIVDYFSVIQ